MALRLHLATAYIKVAVERKDLRDELARLRRDLARSSAVIRVRFDIAGASQAIMTLKSVRSEVAALRREFAALQGQVSGLFGTRRIPAALRPASPPPGGSSAPPPPPRRPSPFAGRPFFGAFAEPVAPAAPSAPSPRWASMAGVPIAGIRMAPAPASRAVGRGTDERRALADQIRLERAFERVSRHNQAILADVRPVARLSRERFDEALRGLIRSGRFSAESYERFVGQSPERQAEILSAGIPGAPDRFGRRENLTLMERRWGESEYSELLAQARARRQSKSTATGVPKTAQGTPVPIPFSQAPFSARPFHGFGPMPVVPPVAAAGGGVPPIVPPVMAGGAMPGPEGFPRGGPGMASAARQRAQQELRRGQQAAAAAQREAERQARQVAADQKKAADAARRAAQAQQKAGQAAAARAQREADRQQRAAQREAMRHAFNPDPFVSEVSFLQAGQQFVQRHERQAAQAQARAARQAQAAAQAQMRRGQAQAMAQARAAARFAFNPDPFVSELSVLQAHQQFMRRVNRPTQPPRPPMPPRRPGHPFGTGTPLGGPAGGFFGGAARGLPLQGSWLATFDPLAFAGLTLAAGGVFSVDRAVRMESAMRDLERLSGGDFTPRDFARMRRQAVAMPRTSMEDLIGITEQGLRAGLSAREAAATTRAGVALRSLAPEENVERLMQSLLRMSRVMGTSAADAEGLVSALAMLERSMPATATEILDVSQRLSGALTHVTGARPEQILAMGGLIPSVGLRSEAGSTAVIRMMQEFFTNREARDQMLRAFGTREGNIRGIGLMANQDPFGALRFVFQEFLRASQGKGAQEVGDMLAEAGLENIRDIAAFTQLAREYVNSFDKLTAQAAKEIKTRQEAEKAIAVESAKIRASLEELGDSFKDLAHTLGDLALPAIGQFSTSVSEIVRFINRSINGPVDPTGRFGPVPQVPGAAIAGGIMAGLDTLTPIGLFNRIGAGIGLLNRADLGAGDVLQMMMGPIWGGPVAAAAAARAAAPLMGAGAPPRGGGGLPFAGGIAGAGALAGIAAMRAQGLPFAPRFPQLGEIAGAINAMLGGVPAGGLPSRFGDWRDARGLPRLAMGMMDMFGHAAKAADAAGLLREIRPRRAEILTGDDAWRVRQIETLSRDEEIPQRQLEKLTEIAIVMRDLTELVRSAKGSGLNALGGFARLADPNR